MEHVCEVKKLDNTVVAFGSFDSVHRGHLKVAQATAKKAEEMGAKSVIFSLHDKEQVLTTEEEKEYLFDKEQINILLSCAYDEVKEMTADAFVNEILVAKLDAKAVVVGKDYKVGSDLCDVEGLKAICQKAGVEVVVCDMVEVNGKVLTREDVKEAFDNCELEKVTELCGHPYIMIGEVVHGKALGRTVGMPTANLGVADEKIKPPSGVYATLSEVDGEIRQGLTNIGKRPSVDNFDLVTIETHLLNFKKDIYGQRILLEVHTFIRGVVKFDNLEEVQQQVQKDLQQVQDFLNELTA